MGLMSVGGGTSQGNKQLLKTLNNSQVGYWTIMKSTADFVSTNGREYHNTSGEYVIAGQAVGFSNYAGWVIAGRTEESVASSDSFSIAKTFKASSGKSVTVRTLSSRFLSTASGFTINGSYRVANDAWLIPETLDTTSGSMLQDFVDLADTILP